MIDTAVASTPARRRSLPEWWGWAVLLAVSLVLLATWLPHMAAPLGDSAEGRVLARFGLHVRNFWDLGPVDSAFATSMRPYVFSTNYAHHPPFSNFFEVGTSAVAGQGEWQLRTYGYVSGLATIWFMAALLRQLKLRWIPVLLAVGMMVATNMFWIYGRVGGGFAMVTGMAAIVVYLRRVEDPAPMMVLLGALAGFATVMTSWPAMATAALLGLWLLKGRGLDRVTWTVGIGMVLGAVVTGVWILNATDVSELAGQTELRTGGTFTWLEFVQRQWFRATELTPSWYRALMFPALAAGFADRRTRWVTVLLFAAPFAWTFGGREGAFGHEFWNLPWMAAIAVGMAALFDITLNATPKRAASVGAGVVALLLVASFVNIARGPAYDKYFGVSAEAGALLDEVAAPDQDYAWVLQNVPGARWVAYYWGKQPRTVTADNLADVPGEAIVVVRTSSVPEWIPDGLDEIAVDQRGRYGLVVARDLQKLVDDG